jgi:hypothetical protein
LPAALFRALCEEPNLYAERDCERDCHGEGEYLDVSDVRQALRNQSRRRCLLYNTQ